MAQRKLHAVHPGEVLFEEFLRPLELSQNRLALDIGVPARRINEIVLGKRSVSADTALRLARYFGMTPQFWMGIQADYDLDVAADRLRDRIRREVRPQVYAPGKLKAVVRPGMKKR
jgi:addiction module HigA family antidote